MPTPDDVLNPKIPKQIVEIEVWVTYCTPAGEKKRVELNTAKMWGLIWDYEACDSELPGMCEGSTGNPNPNAKLPKKGPIEDLGSCPRQALRDGPACCWWNGKEWICPDEIE